MGRLEGKLALVTGASRGYGRAIAQRLARDGAVVAAHYATNDKAMKTTLASIKAGGEGISGQGEPRRLARDNRHAVQIF